MKLFKRSIATLMVLMLVVSVLTLGISADTQTQDGLTVTLTTDKESYEAGEGITATLTVTNNNETAMETVTLKQLIPEGYELAEGQESEKTVNGLNAGDTVTLTVQLVAVTEAEDDSFNLMEFYREHKTIVHIAGIVLGVILLAVLVALGIQKLRYSFLSMLLCAGILLGAVSGTVVQAQALAPIEGSISVSAVVTADGQERKLEAAVDYSMVPEETTEAVCTVTFDTLGGSAVEPQQIDNGGLAVRPDVPTREGHVFVGWFADEACENAFDFTAPITKSCTVYAYWINTEDETDTDGDGLTDELERYFGTDKEKVDTDGDGLNDYVEVMVLTYDPLKTDTDGNGTTDDREDLDQDGLDNKTEIDKGTDPAMPDTDDDGLADGMEIDTYHTDPLVNDTDGDGVSDGKEIELGTDPLSVQTTFEVEVIAENEDSVIPSVKIDLPGEQVESLSIEAVHNETFFPETMPGYMGQAYDFNVDGEFESAEISFEFDASLLEAGADPVIYYFNEETQELEALETVIEGNVAKATVQHFSKYILIDRSIYEDQFMWTDVWDSEHNYTDIEIVFVIDDSGSMDWNDPYFERLSVARTLIDNLPVNSKIGLVRFDGGYPKTEALTKTLTADKEVVKNFLTREYFYSPGGTDMYNGINKAFPLFESAEPTTLKMMIVLSDGETGDTYLHSSVIETANNSNVRIYTVGLGSSTSYFSNYMKPLATNTGAVFYLASDATQLAEIYRDIKEKIDIETDSDDDGIPDYYEDNMIYFNGVKLVLDKNNPDSDGDGLKDGEEVELKYEYNEDRTQVKVTGRFLRGNPMSRDSDGDGLLDNEVCMGYRTTQDGVDQYIVAPIDPHPLSYDGKEGAWLNHIQAQQNPENVAGSYHPSHEDFRPNVPDFVVDIIVSASLELEKIRDDGFPMKGAIENILKFVFSIVKLFAEPEELTIIGAYLLNFVPDNILQAYHSQPDTWQRAFGYNDFYDTVFEIGSSMDTMRYEIQNDKELYMLWMWKGDYWNLQSGAEVGLYVFDQKQDGQNHFNTIDFELPMTLSLYNYYNSERIDNLFNWAPEEKQWWVTGFNPDYKRVRKDIMLIVSSINLSENDKLYRAMKNGEAKDRASTFDLIFDDERHIVWIMWN